MNDIYKIISRGYVRGQLDDVVVVGVGTIGDAPKVDTAAPKVEPVRMREDED